MRARCHNLIAFALTLLVIVQASIPISAMAMVSVRCAGAPVGSRPCAVAVTSYGQSTSDTSRAAVKACCRAMGPHCAMMMLASYSMVRHGFVGHRCIVTVTPLTGSTASRINVRHRWLLSTAPALAPPITQNVIATASLVVAVIRASTATLPRIDLSGSHGLRAPPSA